jgi:uncharacterized protein involved in response to NO
MAASAALRRRLDYVGPAIFSYGFRPFFLGGAIWAALSISCGCRNISATSPCSPRSARSIGTSTR